jgi:hypothetical protein
MTLFFWSSWPDLIRPSIERAAIGALLKLRYTRDMALARNLTTTDLPPEDALPWQKLAAAIRSLIGDAELARAEAALADSGLDPYERQVQAIADVMVARGLVDPTAMKDRIATLAVALAGDKDRAHPRARFSNARPNDIGGLPGGPIDPSAGETLPWENLIVALGTVLRLKGLTRIDEARRSGEDLGDDYHRLGYFQRMAQGGANLLCEKGILTRAELEARIAAIKERR